MCGRDRCTDCRYARERQELWMFSNWVKTEEFSDFKSFIRFLVSPSWLWVLHFLHFLHFHGLIKLWKGWECRGNGCRLQSCPEIGARVGTREREPALWSWKRGPEEPRSTCPRGEALRVQRRLPESVCQVPSNGCKLRSVGKICLFLCITDRPDPGFSELLIRVFWALFAKRKNGERLLPSFFFPFCLHIHGTCNWGWSTPI